MSEKSDSKAARVLALASELRWQLPQNLHDRITEAIYAEAARIASRTVRQQGGSRRLAWQSRLDHWLTHPPTGFPVMIAVLGVVLWLTISGANYPSQLLSDILVG